MSEPTYVEKLRVPPPPWVLPTLPNPTPQPGGWGGGGGSLVLSYIRRLGLSLGG